LLKLTLRHQAGQVKRRLQEMVQLVIAKIEALMQTARDNYGVDPSSSWSSTWARRRSFTIHCSA